MPQQIQSPSSGKTLIKVATKQLTPASDTSVKTVTAPREFIEVIVSDSRIVSRGSQWGHTAIYVNGKVYSRAHDVYFTTTYDDYVKRNSYRDSIGLQLWISPREREILQKELDRRVATDAPYSLFDNSCSSNVADVLEMIGILAHDPRWIPFPVPPAEILAVVSKSNRLVKKIPHTKNVVSK